MTQKKKKSLKDDPKAQELFILLMAGRASERMDILEELDRRIEAPEPYTVRDLREFRTWLHERDTRLKKKA